MRKKSLLFNIFFIILILTQSINAQQSYQNRRQQRQGQVSQLFIRGTVIDWEYNPVNKAFVLVPELNKSVETDESGKFEIKQVPPGTYHVFLQDL